jgi:hypothetical protein
VAIVQISRVTQRKGLEEDLPQPLAGAELGWAVDQRRLFIGNGTLAEGAPVIGNTEILTEFSDILAVASSYTYQGAAAGYTVQTGATAGEPVTQSLQSWMDQWASVKDFGATGDGLTDDTEAINRALYQLYCVQTNPQIRRSLFFPAGVYRVSDTILIPPYSRLYGEGANSSILQFVAQLWFANTAYQAGVLVKYDNGTIYNLYRSKIPVPATGIAISNTTYWETVASLPAYVAQTADSLQQTGINIGVNNAVPPRNVEIQDLCFETQEFANDSSLGTSHSVFLIEQASQISITNTNFLGPLTTNELTTATEEMTGVSFSGTAARVCTNVTIDQCRFSGMSYGVRTIDATKGITVSNSWFDTLYQGVVLGDSAPLNGGPTGFRIAHNIFDNIYAQGVVMEQCSLNGTAYNVFYDVGNSFFGYPVSSGLSTPVISIDAANNVSVGDMFERTDQQAQTQSRVSLYNSSTGTVVASLATTNAAQFQLGTWSRNAGQQAALNNNVTNQALFTVDTDITVANGGFQAFRMEYTIYRLTAGTKAIRTGILTVVAGGDDSAAEGLVYNDEYTENEGTDITLLVTESSDVITVSYTAANTGYNGTIYYSLTHLA